MGPQTGKPTPPYQLEDFIGKGAYGSPWQGPCLNASHHTRFSRKAKSKLNKMRLIRGPQPGPSLNASHHTRFSRKAKSKLNKMRLIRGPQPGPSLNASHHTRFPRKAKSKLNKMRLMRRRWTGRPTPPYQSEDFIGKGIYGRVLAKKDVGGCFSS